ncbi:hypothetical protein NBRC111894_4598 [Sporolactobacillus inulinus]|uniref:Uncharacterized protein n=1 Tax=Sporolactobacillus inulinus TaxID=2078 RepID=A0A4Y1ZJC3_9BACL|nr:hypothetical protein NBRC111894_4598 [Sporolactobacillus inulinus]
MYQCRNWFKSSGYHYVHYFIHRLPAYIVEAWRAKVVNNISVEKLLIWNLQSMPCK